jgi:hypothetical protein
MTDSASWITITVGGAVAGATVAALTYSSTLASSKALAVGSSISINILGELVGYGATYFGGNAAGMSVRIMAFSAGKTSENVIKNSGYMAAAGAATVAGALTALTVTVGTRAFEYSVEYGGKISKDVAQKISEAYLKYKFEHTQFSEYTTLEQLEDNDWVILQVPSGEPLICE